MSKWMMLFACKKASPVAMSRAINRPLPYLQQHQSSLFSLQFIDSTVMPSRGQDNLQASPP